MRTQMYATDYPRSLAEPDAFWLEQAARLAWYTPPTRGLVRRPDNTYRWFEGGTLNTCYLAVDYHVQHGRGNQVAIAYDSPATHTQYTLTYSELQAEVSLFAGVLTNLGVGKGDTVVIYMSMVPQAAIAMLACARIGAVHSVVFGGFAAHELAMRIDDARPKVLLVTSAGKEFDRVIPYMPIVDRALSEAAAHQPDHVVVFQRHDLEEAPLKEGRDLDWMDLLEQASPAGCVAVDAADPLYILYTSGTTGKPKGIVRDNSYAVALRYSMEYLYDVQPGETFWAASDVGWVVGHSYIVYAPLIQGCTSILFEGKPVRTPDPGTFFRVIEQYKVKSFFTAPTAFRAVKKEDPHGEFARRYDTSSLKYLFLAGERCDIATLEWAQEILHVPVIDHWWQTESGWPMITNPAGYGLVPVKPGSATLPVPGFNIHILHPDGTECEDSEEGAVAIKLPLPPACLPTLWQNEAEFQQAYLSQFPGYYFTGDGGYRDADGYLYITGRIDDVINVAGHRLSTAEMEEAVSSHPAVAECAVIGIADELKGQVPVGFVVLKAGVTLSDAAIEHDLVGIVRDTIGAVASFRRAIVVKRLPKTRSGKILRKIMRAIADGKPFKAPSTIEDPEVLHEIAGAMQAGGVGEAFTLTV